MTVRSSMADLISRVRTLIGDPAGESQQFDDQTIQDTLDGHRYDHTRDSLYAVSAVNAAGLTTYTDYRSDESWWEDTVLLQDGLYKTIDDSSTPISLTAADLRTGQWTLSGSLNPPLYITGWSYDIYGAATEMCDLWLAAIKLDYDFLSSGRTFKRSQQMDGLERLRNMYAGRQRLSVGIMIRTDMNVGY